MSEETNQAILAELRQVRSIGRRVFFLLLLLVLVSVLAFPSFRRSRPASQTLSWKSVDSAMNEQDFPKALREAQALVAQEPHYYYGQAYLGLIYLSMGDITNAEAHYAQAYHLFPMEQSDKDLAAVRKRLATERTAKLLSK